MVQKCLVFIAVLMAAVCLSDGLSWKYVSTWEMLISKETISPHVFFSLANGDEALFGHNQGLRQNNDATSYIYIRVWDIILS